MVKPGQEALRFSIHSYNTTEEIDALVNVLLHFK
jgi:selenocysteine lyase/cysteine desulfurase